MWKNRDLTKCLMNSGLETKSSFSFENEEVKSLTVDLKMHVWKFLIEFIYEVLQLYIFCSISWKWKYYDFWAERKTLWNVLWFCVYVSTIMLKLFFLSNDWERTSVCGPAFSKKSKQDHLWYIHTHVMNYSLGRCKQIYIYMFAW